MTSDAPGQTPLRFGFLLLERFTLISMSSAVEALRMANRLARQDIYFWTTLSVDGAPVTASDGLTINVDRAIGDRDAFAGLDALVVCGGIRVEDASVDVVVRFLKEGAKRGLELGGIDTGAYVLAKAGLLDGFRCSVHWEMLAAFTETFPDVQVRRSLFTVDRDRFTSAGGITPLDMMLFFVRRQCGPEISAGVAEQFAYERVRGADERQRIPLRHSAGGHSAKLVGAVELMEANIGEPISQSELAGYVGLSRRQLQRLFQKYLLCSPSRYYLQLRLQRARELLHQSDMSLIEISAQAGFAAMSHFSKSYKEFFGVSPSTERRDRSS